ncbi:MAG: protein-glutamate O-methyltransferase CheR [Planctomycetota bacterium]
MTFSTASDSRSPASTRDFSFDPNDCVALCDLLHQWIGVAMEPTKTYLISSRLRGILARREWSTLGQLVDQVQRSTELVLRDEVIEAMTTHETLFFRDQHPFDAIASTLIGQSLRDRVGQRYRVHCVACSTGQEPYSLMMRLTEALSESELDRVEISASDISRPTIEIARQGQYLSHELDRGLSSERRDRFFRPVETGSSIKRYELISSVRRHVRFEVINLSKFQPTDSLLYLCLCRNVLIYFDEEKRQAILRRLAKWISPGGYLIVGASEMLRGTEDLFARELVSGSPMYRRLPD